MPGEAVGPVSPEGEGTAGALEGSMCDKLESVELGLGGALRPESLEGDGGACSRDGDVEP